MGVAHLHTRLHGPPRGADPIGRAGPGSLRLWTNQRGGIDAVMHASHAHVDKGAFPRGGPPLAEARPFRRVGKNRNRINESE